MTAKQDSLDTVGATAGLPPVGTRDAVHVAVFVATCVDRRVTPGQRVCLAADAVHVVPARDCPFDKSVGIVDPYLTDPVEPGTPFWVFLDPKTVTGLRHVWTHPAFPEEEPTCPRG